MFIIDILAIYFFILFIILLGGCSLSCRNKHFSPSRVAFYISPILQTLLHRKMSHNITIDRSGILICEVSEKMLQLIETNSSLANKRMLWKFNDVEYFKIDHRLYEAYLDNCR